MKEVFLTAAALLALNQRYSGLKTNDTAYVFGLRFKLEL